MIFYYQYCSVHKNIRFYANEYKVTHFTSYNQALQIKLKKKTHVKSASLPILPKNGIFNIIIRFWTRNNEEITYKSAFLSKVQNYKVLGKEKWKSPQKNNNHHPKKMSSFLF